MVAWLHCFWTVGHHGRDHVMEHSCSPHGDWEAESEGEGARCRPQVRTFEDPSLLLGSALPLIAYQIMNPSMN